MTIDDVKIVIIQSDDPFTKASHLTLVFMFFTLIFGDYFLFSRLAKCGRDESCTGKLAPISPKGPKFVGQTDFSVHR